MVKEGDVLEVTRQESLACSVLFYKDDSKTLVGTPYLDDVSVELEKLEDKKGDKVVVARFRAKSRHRRKKGHRQPMSVIKVKNIGLNGSVSKTADSESPVKEEPVSKKVVRKRVTKEKIKEEK